MIDVCGNNFGLWIKEEMEISHAVLYILEPLEEPASSPSQSRENKKTHITTYAVAAGATVFLLIVVALLLTVFYKRYKRLHSGKYRSIKRVIVMRPVSRNQIWKPADVLWTLVNRTSLWIHWKLQNGFGLGRFQCTNEKLVIPPPPPHTHTLAKWWCTFHTAIIFTMKKSVKSSICKCHFQIWISPYIFIRSSLVNVHNFTQVFAINLNLFYTSEWDLLPRKVWRWSATISDAND